MKAKKEQGKSTLGECIRLERQRAGLTQAQLGQKIGLTASRVSKIEHGAPITPEVASFILGKMGSELKFNVVNTRHDSSDELSYLVPIIYSYSKINGISFGRAYRYIKTFKAMDYLLEYKEIEQTLSYEDVARDISRICANNGGAL